MIRLVLPSDSNEILKIYSPYIKDTAITFETEVPTSNDISNRIKQICKQYPYLVYVFDGKIIGYAYASKC